MRVLVTGASSLIGRELAETLTRRGDSVVCFQRHAVGSPRAVSVPWSRCSVTCATPAPSMPRRPGATPSCISRPRSAWSATWEEYRSVNVDGTANVLAAARRAGIRRFVHVSSPSVAHGGGALIGAGADPPVTRSPAGVLRRVEGHRREPRRSAATSDDMAVVAIRPHLVWGPGDTQLVGRIVERARAGRLALVGGGDALVDTTYIDNAVSALVAALDAVRPGAACAGRAYVIANGEPRPIRDLIAGICAAAGVEFAPRDVPLAAATSGRVRRRTGLAAAAPDRRAAAHPVPRRAVGHRPLVRPPAGGARPGLGADREHRRGAAPARRVVRAGSRNRPVIARHRRYPRRASATWQSGSCNGLQSRVPGFNSRRRLQQPTPEQAPFARGFAPMTDRDFSQTRRLPPTRGRPRSRSGRGTRRGPADRVGVAQRVAAG